jgi:hypothetical protein
MKANLLSIISNFDNIVNSINERLLILPFAGMNPALFIITDDETDQVYKGILQD